MAGGAPISSHGQGIGSDKSYTGPLIVLTTLFFMWGGITCLNDILIPHLKSVFELSNAEAGLIQSAFFGAYFIVSLLYFIISVNFGDPLSKIGYKNGIIIGLLIAGVGCMLFYPAADSKLYGVFLCALFILAGGITILQMAANPYVALLGPSETSSSRLNLTQAFNSFGTTIAPIIGSALIFARVGGEENATADTVKMPYIALAITLFIIAIIIKTYKLPKVQEENIERGLGVLKYNHLVLGAIGIFAYVGGEVAIGSWLVDFMQEEHIAGYTKEQAGNFVAFYWGGAMIGRFIGSMALVKSDKPVRKYSIIALIVVIATVVVYFVSLTFFANHADPDQMAFNTTLTCFGLIVINIIAFQVGRSVPNKTLGLFALIVTCLLVVTVSASGKIAMWSVLGIGLFNSIMFPTIFTLAIKGLGKYTSQGSSILVMAIVGGAIMTPLQGAIADMAADPVTGRGNHQVSYILPIICYLYIVFYGFVGYKPRKEGKLLDIS